MEGDHFFSNGGDAEYKGLRTKENRNCEVYGGGRLIGDGGRRNEGDGLRDTVRGQNVDEQE